MELYHLFFIYSLTEIAFSLFFFFLLVFFEVICPMLMLDEAVLLAISTIRGVHNFFSRLRNLKDENNDHVFNTIDFRVECKRPECKENSDSCPHVLAQLPSHLSADKAARVKLLMSGEEDLYLQEIQNIESDPSEPMFNRHDVDWMFDEKNRYAGVPFNHVERLITVVDPNGGGLSKYAVLTFAIVEGKSVVSLSVLYIYIIYLYIFTVASAVQKQHHHPRLRRSRCQMFLLLLHGDESDVCLG